MSSRKTIIFFLAGVTILPITLFGITSWFESRVERLPVLGPENHVVGGFSFKNQLGEDISLDQWKGKIVVANYFFTSCPSVCPKLISALQKVQALGSKKVLISSFTVDPERDSVGRLKAYADKHSIYGDWFLLTGKKISLYKFARTDLMIDATDGDGGPADFIHSDQLVLIDPMRRIRGFYTGTDEHEVNRLIRDIGKLQVEFHL
jgi:protein SCO1/2